MKFTPKELELIQESLSNYLDAKYGAMIIINDNMLRLKQKPFTKEDFGIDKIDLLQEMIESALDEDSL